MKFILKKIYDTNRFMIGNKIIDFHTHVFPDKLYQAIKDWFVKNVGWHFYFEGSSKDILDFLEKNEQIEYYLCFGYAHKPNISMDLNKFYASIKNNYKKAIPLGCFHQDDSNIQEVIEQALKAGLIGFKLHCHVQKIRPDDKRLYKVYEIIIKNNSFILFHAGTGPFTNEYVGFKYFEKILDKFPELNCVVAHLGAFESELFLNSTIKYPNLYLDTSYTFIANPTNIMTAPLDLFKKAYKKIFFGSDFPGICHSFDESVKAIANLPLNIEEKEHIFYKNAKKFLSKFIKL